MVGGVGLTFFLLSGQASIFSYLFLDWQFLVLWESGGLITSCVDATNHLCSWDLPIEKLNHSLGLNGCVPYNHKPILVPVW